ncbi:MAG: hypothetical protein ACF8QF_06260 [Phycisphaerales bacterium]
MRDLSLRDWEEQLRRLGAGDDHAPIDGAPAGFVASRRSLPPEAAPARTGLDDLLWRCVADPAIDWRSALDLDAGPAPLTGVLTDASTIEVWTERELASLHALARLATRTGDDRARDRALDCATWHLEHTQPDNATNRPWAAHVFLLLARDRDSHDARLYAETLVHNCMVTTGKPDPLSAAILRDAADALADEASP